MCILLLQLRSVEDPPLSWRTIHCGNHRNPFVQLTYIAILVDQLLGRQLIGTSLHYTTGQPFQIIDTVFKSKLVSKVTTHTPLIIVPRSLSYTDQAYVTLGARPITDFWLPNTSCDHRQPMCKKFMWAISCRSVSECRTKMVQLLDIFVNSFATARGNAGEWLAVNKQLVEE